MDISIFPSHALAIGIGATAVMDAWTLARRRLFGTPLPDYALVGRWLAHLARGRFRHERIAASPPVGNERALGWAAHYAVGIGFAALLLATAGHEWLSHPTLAPALLLGIATVAAPFLVMQPGMGAGIAASRTPRPNSARLQSLVTHAVFGFGLYAAARLYIFLMELAR
ncbi:MAG TPA: DUF2938 domain-containing protein [Usitatibacter sp.]|nr:DUF2938 domain-containing protein [Usitatibacter sp.]